MSTAAEDEFMAIAVWSERCPLVHKISPEKYPNESDNKYKVPDVFALFEYKGKTIPAFVEVKSTYSTPKPGPLGLRKWSQRYRQRLRNYGDLFGIPVLLAERLSPPGMWFLVALEALGSGQGGVAVDPRNDLMGELFGIFSLTFRKNTKFVMVFDAEGEIAEDEFRGTAREVFWETEDGSRYQKTNSPMMVLFGLGDPQIVRRVEGRVVTLTWEILADISIASYQALGASIGLDTNYRNAKWPWREMLKSGRFPVSYGQLETSREDAGFFRHRFTTRPQSLPNFLEKG